MQGIRTHPTYKGIHMIELGKQTHILSNKMIVWGIYGYPCWKHHLVLRTPKTCVVTLNKQQLIKSFRL